MSPQIRRLTRLVSVLRAENPGPMTLEGTNSLLLRAPGSDGVVVVDPGPDLPEHVQALAGAGPVELVLITHRHNDHTEAIDSLRELTAAPVRAALPEHCRHGQPLRDGERLTAAGVSIEVLATPGHTSDSLSFRILDDAALIDGAAIAPILTGDTVLGRGTTMIDHPDGTLGDYLASLDRLEAVGGMGLPAHGEPLPDLAKTCRELRDHRLERLDEVRAALESMGATAQGVSAAETAERIYPEVPAQVRPAARRSIEAQLAHLQRD